MSQLIYNGVELKLLKTESVTRVPVYSPDGTEYMYTEFTINVLATYSPSPLATSYSQAGNPGGYNLPMVTDAAIRHYLAQPRRYLLYAEGGKTIVQVGSSLFDAALDERNGPIPQVNSIRRITGARLWYVDFSVKTWIIECPSGTFLSPIASSRYSRSESIDQDLISTLTTSGVAFFRSDILEAIQFNADAFRGYLIPTPLLGYQRMSLQFAVASDGLSITWSTTDVERKHDLGDTTVPGTAGSVGITDFNLIYNVSANRMGAEVKMAGWGAIVNIECSAVGCKYASNYDMLKFCLQAAINRFGTTFQSGIMQDAMISDDFMNNSVRLSITYFLLPEANAGLLDLAVPINNFVGQPILNLPPVGGLNPKPFFDSATRGTAAYMLAVNEFAIACFTQPGQVTEDPTGTVIPPNAYVPAFSVGTSPSVSAFYSPSVPPSSSTLARPFNRSGSPTGGSRTTSTTSRSKTKTKRFSGRIILPKSKGGSGTTPTPTPSPSGSSMGSPGSSGSLGDTSDTGAVVIQLFEPFSVRTVDWSVRQYDSLPYLPNPVPPMGDGTAPLYLLESTVDPQNIEMSNDGYTPIYTISGQYMYGITNDVGPKAPVSYNIPDYLEAGGLQPSEFTNVIDTDYIDGMINNDFD